MPLQYRSTKQDTPGPLKIAIYGATKAGKAQPVDQPVLTPFGYRPIGSIGIGDAVIGADGNPTEVTGVFPQGSKEVYRVKFNDRTSTRCCADHLWAIRRRDAELRVTPLRDLGELFYADDSRKYYVPMTAPVQFASTKLPLHPYLLGLLLGDGGFARTGRTPAFHNPEPDLQRRLQELLPPGLTLQPNRGCCTQLITAGPAGGHHTNPLGDLLVAFGLWGHRSIEKFIPPMYMLAAVEDRLELLRGLVDTDGDIDQKGRSVTFNTSSERLRDDFIFLLQSLGGTARWHARTPTYVYDGERREGHEAYRVNVRLPIGLRPCSSEKHLARWQEDSSTGVRHPPSRAIDAVEFDGKEECVCIKVAAEDGLYLTNDCIVTHNTYAAGTFPSPFFFSLGVESGIATLSQLEQEAMYVTINTMAEMVEATRMFKADYKAKGWRTAVVDTVTLFGRMVQMELTDGGKRGMEHRDWMKFLLQFLNLRDALHSCDVHVVWVFHVDEVQSGDVVMRLKPKLAGQAQKEILQTVGIIAYLDKIELNAVRNEKGDVLEAGRTVHRLWTKCPEDVRPPFEAGSWYDGPLSADLPGQPPRMYKGLFKPDFNELMKYLAPRGEDGKPLGTQHVTP